MVPITRVTPLNDILFLVLLALSLFSFAGPVISTIGAVICTAFFFILSKRFRNGNNIFVQIAACLSMLVFPVSLLYRPLESIVGLFFNYWSEILKISHIGAPVIVGILEGLPVAAFMGFFCFWLALFTIKLIKIFPNPIFGVAILVAQILMSLLFIVAFCALQWVIPQVLASLKTPEHRFSFQPISLLLSVVDTFTNFGILSISAIIFFIPFTVLLVLAYRSKKMIDMKGLLIMIQSFVVLGLLFIISVVGSKLLDCVVNIGIIILALSFGMFPIGGIVLNVIWMVVPMSLPMLKVLIWFLIQFVAVLETFSFLFVFGQILGNVYVHEISKTQFSKMESDAMNDTQF